MGPVAGPPQTSDRPRHQQPSPGDIIKELKMAVGGSVGMPRRIGGGGNPPIPASSGRAVLSRRQEEFASGLNSVPRSLGRSNSVLVG